jgi:hypothetical protein
MAVQAGTTFQLPPGDWNINGIRFDAWLKLNHNSSLTITQHPVEFGAAITDHSYVNPDRFSFDLAVSNVKTLPSFSGASNRNVNAYNTLKKLQASRDPLTLTCKYGNYEDILIESMDALDDFQTKNTLKVTVNLVRIITVDSKFFDNSTNPHATDSTKRGKVSPVPDLGTGELVRYAWNALFR